jgi:DNA-3-methyladenine glycosylase
VREAARARDILERSSVEVAPLLLGAVLTHDSPDGAVSVRLTELEAYIGDGADPGSHAFRGMTKRNAVMYGEAGRLYTYFTYGMHVCANIICSPEGDASGVLIRAGEVVSGLELARRRRGSRVADRDLARGPARLVVAMGIELSENGSDLFVPPFSLALPERPSDWESGPRTGVSGAGGSPDYPWRFWVPGDPTVSPYRKAVPRKRAPAPGV